MRLTPMLGGVSAAAVIALALPFVAKWEGKSNVAYRDVIGVLTICYGETQGVKPGERRSDAACRAGLERGLAQYYAAIEPCITNPAVPVGVRASLLELAWNVGPSAVCQSTMMRLANAGQWARACAELDRWVKAGGKTWRGLVNRRNDSQASLCGEGW